MGNNEQKNFPVDDSKQTNRRELIRRVAYVTPLILGAVKATERPAYAQGTGAPVQPLPVPSPAG